MEALEKVQPVDLTAAEISVRLGATWIPPEDYEDFMYELFGTPYYARWKIKIHFPPTRESGTSKANGRKLALDQRLMNELLPKSETGKVAACAQNVFEIWQRTTPQRSSGDLHLCDREHL